MQCSTLLLALAGVIAAPVEGTNRQDDKPVALADAVKEFNQSAADDPVGLTEAPLTEDEVISSLRGISRGQNPRMTDDVYNAFQKIIITRMIPAKAKLGFTNGWTYNGYAFTVWWVDLSVMTGDATGYTYRLRDRKISSRPLTEAEREKL
jgi:hypothetical protein